MPAACSRSSRLSIRNASMTMSWVAEAAATQSAPTATMSGEAAGSQNARKTIAPINSSCASTSQARRRPSNGESSGRSSASTSGAHANFTA